MDAEQRVQPTTPWAYRGGAWAKGATATVGFLRVSWLG
jgi:hypothetical protein